MPGRVLLDTNAAIAHLKQDPLVRAVLAVADEVFLPSVALGELYFGAAKAVPACCSHIVPFVSAPHATVRRSDEEGVGHVASGASLR